MFFELEKTTARDGPDSLLNGIVSGFWQRQLGSHPFHLRGFSTVETIRNAALKQIGIIHSSPHVLSMATFYEFDSSKVTLREMSWGSKNPIVLLIGAGIKLCRVQIPSSSDDANVDWVSPFVVEELPANVAEKFAPLAGQLAALGFCDPVYHWIEDHHTLTKIAWATFRDPSGQYCARIHYRYWGRVQKPERALFPLFITSFMDGTFLVSSSGKPDVAAPETVEMQRMHKADLHKLWSAHEHRANVLAGHKEIYAITSRETLIDSSERLHALQRDFHLARGFFRERTAAEQQQAETEQQRIEQFRGDGTAYPEVMAELARLQEQKVNWTSTVILFAVSLGLFFGIGAAQWQLKTTLLLIPVLFFHEAGHWLAMVIFKYRNMRMFFIPFFGAAVTGRNWNVAGWKKALVSLAGPLPGIGLGVTLGILSAFVKEPLLKQAALMLVAINGLNLLPVMPLDGGQFLRTVLFCRNRWLDIVFRIVAIVALISLSLIGMRFSVYLAISFAIGLPIAFKMAKITDQFRQRGFIPPPPGDDRIPTGIAEELITAIRQELPPKTTNKVIAAQTASVYETLNAHPPGGLATAGLLALYGGGLVASIICAVALVVTMRGTAGDFFRAAVRQPPHAAVCSDTEVWKGRDASTVTNVNMVVSTFNKAKDAQTEYKTVIATAPKDSSVLLFGSSLLMKLPAADDAAREKWFNTLQSKATNTFVLTSNRVVTTRFMFVAPDLATATNIETELNDYFGTPQPAMLVAPWRLEAASSDFKKFRQARRVWQEIKKEVQASNSDSRFKEIGSKFNAASRRGDTAEKNKLLEKEKALRVELLDAARERLRRKYASSPYSDLTILERDLSEISYTNKVERAKVVEQVTDKLGRSPTHLDRTLYLFGTVSRHGLLVEVPYLAVVDPEENVPLLMDWLCRQKCSHFKYEFQRYNYDDLD